MDSIIHELPRGKSCANTLLSEFELGMLSEYGVGLEVVVVGNLTYPTWAEWTGQTQFEATRSRVLSQDKDQYILN